MCANIYIYIYMVRRSVIDSTVLLSSLWWGWGEGGVGRGWRGRLTLYMVIGFRYDSVWLGL